MMGLKLLSVLTAITLALVVLCVYPTAAQSPGLSLNLVVTPNSVWPGGAYTITPTYTLDTPAAVSHADAVFTISRSPQITGIPAGCTAQHQNNGIDEIVVTCPFSGLAEGTHPLFGTGITGTIDTIAPNDLFIEGSLNADYPGGAVSGSASTFVPVRHDVPGDAMAIRLVSMTASIVPGGKIIYDVLYTLQTNLLIDHSYAFFNLDPAVTVTSVGINCEGSGSSADCGSMMGGMHGGTGSFSGIGFATVEGIVSPLVQPGYMLTSSVSWYGIYDGGWGGLSAANTTTTRVVAGDPVAVPEFPGPEPLALGLAGLAAVVLLAKRRH